MDDCEHHKQLVWAAVNAYGKALYRTELREQCTKCGQLFSRSMAHALASATTPNVDQDALRVWRERDRARWQAKSDEWHRQRAEQDAAWWDRYDNYLQSDAWRRLRPLVFQRAGGICEGCRRAEATQVHHLTYKNVTCEFLWELVAVCPDCHERVHGRQFDDAPV